MFDENLPNKMRTATDNQKSYIWHRAIELEDEKRQHAHVEKSKQIDRRNKREHWKEYIDESKIEHRPGLDSIY